MALEPRVSPTRPRVRWWREVLYIGAFYGVYTLIRNQFGSVAVKPERAFNHAMRVIDAEKAVGLFHEATVQGWFLSWHWFIRFWDVYYGTTHFVVTAVALVWCFRRRPEAYPLWRNTLAATTGIALIGFATFPLMPPRLLDSPLAFGGRGLEGSAHFGFVDTLEKIGGLWSFDSGTMVKISNQYAAMPSLHTAWAMWVTIVMWPGMRSRVSKALVAFYPFATLFCIVVTANHYWIDGVAGLLTLLLGYLLARSLTRRGPARQAFATQKIE